MKKSFCVLASALLAVTLAAAFQFGGAPGNHGSMAPAPPRKAPTTRTLTGLILDQRDAPLASAVVYLKNTRTNAIRTYISNNDGGYQFGGLEQNQDYELHAEYKGDRSALRRLSAFDSRPNPSINLKIEVRAKK